MLDILVSDLQKLIPIILTMTSRNKYYYPYFIDEETGTESLSNSASKKQKQGFKPYSQDLLPMLLTSMLFSLQCNMNRTPVIYYLP